MAKLQYKRFPGDVIVVPNVIGVLLNSFVPGFLNIGSFWTAMVHGTGALLGIITTFVVCAVTVFVERLFFKEGFAGAAISSVAAYVVANPQALADVDPNYAAIAQVATAQIAAAVIVTSFLTPMFAAWVAKKEGKA